MLVQRPVVIVNLLVFAILSAPTGLRAESNRDENLFKAYYLEKQDRDFAAARDLYERVASRTRSAEDKLAARRGAARCRDALAAQDFARLMPADSLVYLELNRPGEIIEKFADMIGLAGPDMQAVLAQRPGHASNAPFHIPSEIIISPALFDHLRSFGGAAVALTDIDVEGDRPPKGVIVMHHGDTDVLKGLLETAFQFAPTAQKISGLPTFATDLPAVGEVSGVLTESLLIAGTGPDLVAGVVKRLLGDADDSLGAREDLAEVAAQRKGATLFAYCNLHGMIERFMAGLDERDLNEMKMADAIVDFDSLRWATLAFGIQDKALGLQLALRLADDHRCIAYNLVRFPPMTRQTLAKVPADAAGFVGIGLNPAITLAAAGAARDRGIDQTVTGFDIFREFFGNIREICAYVVPGEFVGGEIPNVGILMAVNDVDKSRALWDQCLSLAGLADGDAIKEPKQMKISSTPVTAYAVPEVGNIYLAELDGCIAVGLSRRALKGAIRAHGGKGNLLDDPVMGKVVADMPRDSSIMIGCHAGRMTQVAAGSGEREMAMVAGPASELCSQMVAWVGLGQAPNQLTIRASVRGLPNVNDALKKFAPMINGMLPAMMPKHDHREKDDLARAETKPPAVIKK